MEMSEQEAETRGDGPVYLRWGVSVDARASSKGEKGEKGSAGTNRTARPCPSPSEVWRLPGRPEAEGEARGQKGGGQGCSFVTWEGGQSGEGIWVFIVLVARNATCAGKEKRKSWSWSCSRFILVLGSLFPSRPKVLSQESRWNGFVRLPNTDGVLQAAMPPSRAGVWTLRCDSHHRPMPPESQACRLHETCDGMPVAGHQGVNSDAMP